MTEAYRGRTARRWFDRRATPATAADATASRAAGLPSLSRRGGSSWSRRPGAEEVAVPLFVPAVGLLALGVTRFIARVAPDVLESNRAAAVRAVVAVSAVAAVAAPGSPTGGTIVDAALRAVLAALVAGAASRARRSAWVVGAAVVVVAGSGSPAAVAGFVALGLAVGATWVGRRGRVLGAIVGAFLGQAMFRLVWPQTFAATAAVAALVTAVLAASAWATLRPESRRPALAFCWGAAVATLLPALAILSTRASLVAGEQAAGRGLAAVRAGNTVAASEELSRAAALLGGAHERLRSWSARPAVALPVLAQHARAATRLSATLSAAAAAAAEVNRLAGEESLSLPGGGIDPEAVAALGPPLSESREALERAMEAAQGSRSPWLIPGLRQRLERLEGDLARARQQARTASLAVEVAPGMLGADGPRRYLLAIQTPAEQRASGGIIGNYGELVVHGGRFELARLGPHDDLEPPPGETRPIRAPTEYLARYGAVAPDRFVLNATLSPDFPTVATILEDLYPRAGGAPVDGVISVDPVALAALLRVTGPVTVPGWPRPLTAENASRTLLHDQYVALAPLGRSKLDEVQTASARAVIDRARSADLPGPARLAAALGPAVRGGHLLLHSVRQKEQVLLERFGVTGAVPPVRGDFLQVVTQNAAESKIDWFQRRAVTYDVRYEPGTGELSSRAEVRITNLAPGGGLPPYVLGGAFAPIGVSRTWVSVYTPHQLLSAELDGIPLAMTSEFELGRQVHSALVEIPPGSTSTVVLDLSGVVPPGDYHLDVGHQPTITPDELTVRVSAERGSLRPFPPLVPGEAGVLVAHVQQRSRLEFAAVVSADGHAGDGEYD